MKKKKTQNNAITKKQTAWCAQLPYPVRHIFVKNEFVELVSTLQQQTEGPYIALWGCPFSPSQVAIACGQNGPVLHGPHRSPEEVPAVGHHLAYRGLAPERPIHDHQAGVPACCEGQKEFMMVWLWACMYVCVYVCVCARACLSARFASVVRMFVRTRKRRCESYSQGLIFHTRGVVLSQCIQ